MTLNLLELFWGKMLFIGAQKSCTNVRAELVRTLMSKLFSCQSIPVSIDKLYERNIERFLYDLEMITREHNQQTNWKEGIRLVWRAEA